MSPVPVEIRSTASWPPLFSTPYGYLKEMDAHKRRGYDRALIACDSQLAKLSTRLSLARCSRNKAEVTRIEREIKRLGLSLY